MCVCGALKRVDSTKETKVKSDWLNLKAAKASGLHTTTTILNNNIKKYHLNLQLWLEIDQYYYDSVQWTYSVIAFEMLALKARTRSHS